MNSLSKNLSATVFSKTFNVLNPYPEHRKIIHSFLSVLPILVFILCMVLVVFLWKIFEYGLLLSLGILIVCLNLILVGEASEYFQTAEIFIRAICNEARLGIGDVKALQMLKKALPRLSNYYLGLSVLFIVSAAALGYIWSSLLWFLSQVVGLMVAISQTTGVVAYIVAVFLFALTVSVLQILISKVKNKFLSF